MLLKLENTNKENIDKLLIFAKENQLKLTVLVDSENNYFLPGKPLNDYELALLIVRGRMSGQINMQKGHSLIMKNFGATE